MSDTTRGLSGGMAQAETEVMRRAYREMVGDNLRAIWAEREAEIAAGYERRGIEYAEDAKRQEARDR